MASPDGDKEEAGKEVEEEVEIQHAQVDTEVLFAKNNVFAYPSRSMRIAGRLTLVKQHCIVFIAWIPYENNRNDGGEKEIRSRTNLDVKKQAEAVAGTETEMTSPTEEGSSSDHDLPRSSSKSSSPTIQQYALQPIPVSEIRYIRRHTPRFGWHYIVIVLKEKGVSLPPLFFHLGGVRKFLSVLKEHVALMRSEHDKNCYVVNEISESIKRTLAPVQDQMDDQMLQGVFSAAHNDHGNGRKSYGKEGEDEEGEGWRKNGGADEEKEEKSQGAGGAHSHSHPHLLSQGGDSASMMSSVLLDKAFVLTRKAYDTTSYFLQDWKETFSDNHFQNCMERRAQDTPSGEEEEKEKGKEGAQSADGDGAGYSQSELTPLDNKTLNTLKEKLQMTLQDGVDFLSTECGSFELLDGEASCSGERGGDMLGLDCYLGARKQSVPLSEQDFESFQNSDGSFERVEELKQRIFEGGCAPFLRRQVYPFLLGYLPFDSTARSRNDIKKQKHIEYEQIKNQWSTITEEQEKKFSKYRERKVQIDKDVIRTDSSHTFFKGKMSNENIQKMRRILLAYAFYNFDLGYCQGMSDLLAPLLYVISDEADAFWCFVGLMGRMERNFDQDQSGMHNQLLALRKLVQLLDPQLYAHLENQHHCRNFLFCYRWLLLHFKREFAFDDCLRLWEGLWTCSFCDQLQMYVCVAILQQFRRKIIEADMGFDDLILFTNDLSYRIPLEESLRNAEILCKFAGEAGKQVLVHHFVI